MSDSVAAPIPRKLKLPMLQDIDLDSTVESLSPMESSGLVLSPLGKISLNLPALLDELLNDCFQYTIDPKGLCDTRRHYVQLFHRFITERHTHENLAFLLEIFRYEYFYDKVHPEAVMCNRASCDGAHLPRSLLNELLHSFVDTLPYPTSSMQRRVQKPNSPLSASTASLLSAPFRFDFDDISPNSADAWDILKDQTVSNDDQSLALPNPEQADPNTLLSDQWEYIMSEFIRNNAPQQINLCNKTAVEIAAEDAHTGIDHPPGAWLHAKIEVMQLLMENAYVLFLREHRHDGSACACKGGCLYSAPTDTRRADVTKVNLDRGICLSSPTTKSEVCMDAREICVNTPAERNRAMPVPHGKLKTKILAHWATNSDLSSSGSSFSSFIQHFKNSHITSPTGSISGRNSRPTSPLLDSSASTPGANESPSILGKLLKKKK